MGVHYADFTPRLLEAEAQFSTLSLTGDVPGPQYEHFETVFRRASEWLYRQKNIEPLSCEVLELNGVYQLGPDTEAVGDPTNNTAKTKDEPKQGIPSYLKVIRIWYRRMGDWQPLENGVDKPVLKFINIMPARLESNPRAFGPKFQTLNDAILSLNEQLQQDPKVIKGRILNIQTSVCRFSTKHCGIDPDRTFWMANNTDDMHVAYFFRIFYIKTKYRERIQIGFRDFTPNCDWKSKKRREQNTDNFGQLVDQATEWMREQKNTTLLNCETVTHNAYYRCARDTPGMESRVLDNPHFRSTYWGLMDYIRILRVFYTQPLAPLFDKPSRAASCQLVSKVFHVHPAVPVDGLRFASITSKIPLNHDQLMHRINDWCSDNGIVIVAMETMNILSNMTKVPLSADDTMFQAAHKGPLYAIYGLRLYAWISADAQPQIKSAQLTPEPRTIRLDEDSCSIL